MFSVRQKREIADAVQKILRATNHSELPDGDVEFSLHVEGAEKWSWADIRNNGAVTSPGVNLHNELQDVPPTLRQAGAATLDDESLRVSHARKQGNADGFQEGWKAALTRIADGDSVETLRSLLPEPPSHRELLAWREMGEEMGRIVSLMWPEDAADYLPDWFGPRLFDLQVNPAALALRQAGAEPTQRLSKELEDKDYRDAYSASLIDVGLPFQIRALRLHFGWTQQELAERAGMTQSRIAELEAPGKRRVNVETLLRLGQAFDLGVQVRFTTFAQLMADDAAFDPENPLRAEPVAAPSPQDLGELRSEVGLVLRQLALTIHRADALPPADYAEKPTVADWRGRAEWLAALLTKTMDRLEHEHLAHLRAVAAPSSAPTTNEQRLRAMLSEVRDLFSGGWRCQLCGAQADEDDGSIVHSDACLYQNIVQLLYETDPLSGPVAAPAGRPPQRGYTRRTCPDPDCPICCDPANSAASTEEIYRLHAGVAPAAAPPTPESMQMSMLISQTTEKIVRAVNRDATFAEIDDLLEAFLRSASSSASQTPAQEK